MINYNRNRAGIVPPEKICKKSEKQKKDAELQKMYDDYINHGTEIEFARGNYGSKVIKNELKKITHNKCGYCEKTFSITYYGDVDHYRPKSKYWWLAYTWENFVPTCTICNSSFKSSHFPVRGTQAETPADDLALEDPFLINPFDEDPEQFIKYELDIDGVYVKPKDSAFKDRIDACEQYYGINREDLTGDRLMRQKLVLFTITVFQSQGISQKLKDDAKNALRILSSSMAEYAGMARYFMAQENIVLD